MTPNTSTPGAVLINASAEYTGPATEQLDKMRQGPEIVPADLKHPQHLSKKENKLVATPKYS
eukprot:769986-Amphidinium_carterae.1